LWFCPRRTRPPGARPCRGSPSVEYGGNFFLGFEVHEFPKKGEFVRRGPRCLSFGDRGGRPGNRIGGSGPKQAKGPSSNSSGRQRRESCAGVGRYLLSRIAMQSRAENNVRRLAVADQKATMKAAPYGPCRPDILRGSGPGSFVSVDEPVACGVMNSPPPSDEAPAGRCPHTRCKMSGG